MNATMYQKEESKMGKVNTDLRNKKAQLKSTWEKDNDLKLEDVLSEEGLNHFWDDETCYIEVVGMLIHATISAAFDIVKASPFAVICGVVHDEEEQDEEPCNAKNDTPFEVERVKDHYFYEDKFESEEAAKEFIKDICLETEHKMADFRVVKVCD